MYRVEWTSQLKKDYKKIIKQGRADIVDSMIEKLARNETLEERHRDHALFGLYQGHRECHISHDLLLIYKKYEHILVLICVRVSSHSELF